MSINTPEDWANAFLAALSAPVTPNNVQAIVAWEAQEGGHWKNTAHYNPLNTTLNFPPDSNINSVGVKAYESWEQGLEANVKTIELSYYTHIVEGLRANVPADQTLHAISASPWGTHFSAPASAYQSYAHYGETTNPPHPPREYIVQRGDNLWNIAKKFYGDGARYHVIATANKIKNVNMIYPGQSLVIP